MQAVAASEPLDASGDHPRDVGAVTDATGPAPWESGHAHTDVSASDQHDEVGDGDDTRQSSRAVSESSGPLLAGRIGRKRSLALFE